MASMVISIEKPAARRQPRTASWTFMFEGPCPADAGLLARERLVSGASDRTFGVHETVSPRGAAVAGV
jgi:hypothetical protein